MTITTTTLRAQYNGNGVTTSFAVPFEFLEGSTLKVILTDVDGVDTTQTITTHYTVTGGGTVQPDDGSVVMVTAPATGEKLTILRAQPLTQAASYTEQGPFPAKAHEKALDRLDMQVQMVSERVNRAIKLKETSANSDLTFPEPSADEVIGWNAAGTALENKTVLSLGSVEVLDEDDMASNSATKVPSQQSVKAYVDAGPSTAALQATMRDRIDAAPYVATRTALKALDTTKDTTAILTESGREGTFVWRSGDYASLITLDTEEGIYVKADAIATTAGAWVRVGGWLVAGADIRWFGAVDGADSTDAIQCVLNLGYTALIPDGDFHIAAVLTKAGGTVRIRGNGHLKSKLTWTSSGNGMEFGLVTPIDRFECVGVSILATTASLSTIGVQAKFATTDNAYHLDFRDNRVSGVQYANDAWGGGVKFTNSVFPQIRNNFIIGRLGISEANIESSLPGIELWDNQLSIGPQIHDNFVIRHRHGIYVHITASPGAEGVYITKNSCVDCTWGIEVLSDFVSSYAGAQYSVTNNHCEFDKKGIVMTALNEVFVNDNMLIAGSAAGSGHSGVHVTNCRRGIVGSNVIQDGTGTLNTNLYGVLLDNTDYFDVSDTVANTKQHAVAFINACTNCNERGLIQQHADNLRFTDVNGSGNNKNPNRNVVSAVYTANADLTTQIPEDDTIPQNTEGTEILTATITPKSAGSRVRITFRAWGTAAGLTYIIAALFKDSGANALQAIAQVVSTGNYYFPLVLEYVDSPASIAAITYKIRVGPASGVAVRLNGATTGRRFGGASSATLIVEEINP